MTDKQIIGIIGLGNMGRGMANTLKRAGFGVIGLDPSAAAVAAAQADGIELASDLKALAAAASTIVLSLPNTQIVQALVQGEQGLAALARPGTLIIDTTTGDPALTRDVIALLARHALRYIDAPVSGGPRGAASGQMTMFIGGSEEDVAAAQPVLAALGSKRFHIGPATAGQVGKLVNNLLVASHLLTASEAFRMAEAAGVSTAQLIDAVNAGSGRSGVTIYNYPSRIMNNAFDSGFTMGLMRKDVGLAIGLIDQLGLQLPISADVGTIWKASAAELADGEDFNRIVTLNGKTA
ncbi:3-hydroxyisobutyrate dehydrogenase [Bordetella genomosp. 10]|uniref:3-hydroxyisobutyrate dehydrogenase n=1 Tax=Bordetella genomosp. 10 TaxID=1416804 RepID=A0A261SB33_9BORD|nr:NAD(P)-dependent oxidoreductase [Bordetella genomosp. 10]OZI34197.1 3-hydroxyisobutyrate dehydrogenase [Bordetella genomosp. 10]